MKSELNAKPKAPVKLSKPEPIVRQMVERRDVGKFVSEKYKDCVVRIVDMSIPGRVEYLQSIGYDFCTEGEYCSSVVDLNAETKFGRDTTDKSRVIWDISKGGKKGVFMFTSKENAERREAEKLEIAANKEIRDLQRASSAK